MTDRGTPQAGEPADTQARCPPHILVIDYEPGNHVTPHRPLPCRADRQKIVEQANLILAEARAIAEQSDRSFVPVLAERLVQCTQAAASSCVVAEFAGAFLGDT